VTPDQADPIPLAGALAAPATPVAFDARARSFLGKVAATFATRIVLLALALVSSVLVARALGPEGRGHFAVAGTLAAIGIQLGNLGLHAFNSYAVARDRTLLAPLLANSLVAALALGGLIAATALAIRALSPGLTPVAPDLFGFALVSIPLGLVYLFFQGLLLGTGEVAAYNRIEIGYKSLAVALIALLAVAGGATAATTFAMTIPAVLVANLAGLAVLRRRLAAPERPSLALLRQGSGYGLRAWLAALFSFLVLRSDLLLVERKLGAAQAGYYAVAAALADTVYILPVVVGTLLFPELSAMRDGGERHRLTGKVARLTAIAMTAAAAVIALLARPLVTLLYGPAFVPVVAPFVWLLPALVLLSVHTILMNSFAAAGMPPITVWLPFLGLVLNLALNLLLLPELGVVGASLSSIGAYGVMLGGSLWYFSTHSRDGHGQRLPA
jgi:O-antigen/teichoic acid export membrane protein